MAECSEYLAVHKTPDPRALLEFLIHSFTSLLHKELTAVVSVACQLLAMAGDILRSGASRLLHHHDVKLCFHPWIQFPAALPATARK